MSRQRSLIFWPIPIRKDREHSWKHHARKGLVRELLNAIEFLASTEEAKSGRRFVFARREALLDMCFKGRRKDGKHYNIRKLDDALAALREQHIISQYFETADERVGFIVAPHDSLCRSDGKTCLLPNRAAWEFVEQKQDWRSKVLAALEQSKRQHEGSENGSNRAVKTAVKTAVLDAINGSENGSENGSAQSLYDANFALLTETERADWLANGLQSGASKRVKRGKRLNEVNDESSSQEIERHHKFLENHNAKKQQQAQPQQQRQSESAAVSSSKPNTVEATATATPKGSRKRPVLSEDEYAQQKTERMLEEFKAELAARPACSKCGGKHEGDCPKSEYITRSGRHRK